MKKTQVKKISKYILIMFMILQPIFDIYYLYTDRIIEIFKFSPATIIRMLLIIYLGISAYLIAKNKIKKKYFLGFLLVYFLYTILHLYNCSIFSVTFQNFQNYSTLRELFYLIRIFSPILLIFVTYNNKLEYKDTKKIILSVYLIFSSIMVITNLLGVALTSYAGGTDTIAANFLTWFSPGTYEKYGYEALASKGIFHMANQVSGVMTAMFPIFIYIILKDKFKISNMLILFMTMLAMFMLGTRIASLGMLAVLVMSIILYFFFGLLKKRKKLFTPNVVVCFIFLLLSLLIYSYLPVSNRTYMQDMELDILNSIKESQADLKLKSLEEEIANLKTDNLSDSEYQEVLAILDEKKLNFIQENYQIYGFDEIYILDLYPYEEDPDFWFSMFNVPFNERCDHRQLKTFITKRILELNNNNLDSLFGISFTRLRNAQIYMENDIIIHFYTIGIIGIILFILPYLLIVLYAFIKMLKNKKHFNYLNITYIMCILLVYLIGYLSGNIFDEWIVTLVLGFITGLLLINIKNLDSKN